MSNNVHFFTHSALLFYSMATKRTKLDRGQILAAVVEASGLKKEDVALKAGYSRSAYYKHVENPNLDYHIVMAYGKAMNHDFTEEFPEMPRYELEEPETIYIRTPKTVDEAILQRDFWRNKYFELLEKYSGIIEEKLLGREER